jgi:hypothetical protein
VKSIVYEKVILSIPFSKLIMIYSYSYTYFVGCSFNIYTIYEGTACKRIADSGVKNPKAYALRESSYLDVGCIGLSKSYF